VQVFDSEGGFQMGFGSYGLESGQLIRPLGVVVDREQRIYVSDAFQNVVLVFSPEGSYLGAVYEEDHPMRTPLGMAFCTRTNRLLVASMNTGAVEVYGIDDYEIPDEEPQARFPVVESGDEDGPEGTETQPEETETTPEGPGDETPGEVSGETGGDVTDDTPGEMVAGSPGGTSGESASETNDPEAGGVGGEEKTEGTPAAATEEPVAETGGTPEDGQDPAPSAGEPDGDSGEGLGQGGRGAGAEETGSDTSSKSSGCFLHALAGALD
jgi:hypothetical protein